MTEVKVFFDRKLWVAILSDIVDDCFVDWYSSPLIRRKYSSLDLYIAERLYDELVLGSVFGEDK